MPAKHQPNPVDSTSRREHLIDAGLRVFADHGFHGATTKLLAAAAGVAPGLLYHYFPSKEHLLLAVIRERGFLPQMRSMLTNAAEEQSAHEVLRALCYSFAKLLAEREALVRVVVREAQGSKEFAAPFGSVISEGAQLLSDFLDARIRSGEFRPHDTQAAARAILFTIVMGQFTRTTDDRLLDGLLDVTLQGIAFK
jgi:AcrR family transcriptional regulator